MLVRKPDISEKFDPNSTIIYENAEFKPADQDHPTGELWAKQAKPGSAKPLPPNPGSAKPLPPFPPAHCERAPFYRAYLELWLDEWLSRYKSYREESLQSLRKGEPFVCGTKVTLKSMFKVLYDVSAGVNAFAAPPIILPISGFNVDASPDYSHSIAISFALQDPKPFPGDVPGGPLLGSRSS
jgi:hypothetical protein